MRRRFKLDKTGAAAMAKAMLDQRNARAKALAAKLKGKSG